MHALIAQLYPICRSITGNGVRETLRLLSAHIPLAIEEVPSGSPALDWTVPLEWNIGDAWIRDPNGRKIVDFHANNLHVVSYSTPVRQRLPLSALRPRLHSLPDRPAWIPYRTSYYREDWGFCLSDEQLQALPEGEYEVCIESSLAPGHLTYGECVLPGQSDEEVLISAHVCHPSLGNDNLSAIAVATFLARALQQQPRRRYTLRFLFAPGTIGALAWLERNRQTAGRIKHGLTLVCLGDGHPFTYKQTIHGDAEIDRVVPLALRQAGVAHQAIGYFPYGYDERQYNSPGFRLNVGSLMRARHGEFPEYHTSADNLQFVLPEKLAESFAVCMRIIQILDGNKTYRNLSPYGEPQLGRRGLYRSTGGTTLPGLELALLWVLALSDGRHSLLDIAERSGIDFITLRHAADRLLAAELLAEVA